MASREEESDCEDELSSDSDLIDGADEDYEDEDDGDDDHADREASGESPLSQEELKSKNVADLVRWAFVSI